MKSNIFFGSQTLTKTVLKPNDSPAAVTGVGPVHKKSQDMSNLEIEKLESMVSELALPMIDQQSINRQGRNKLFMLGR